MNRYWDLTEKERASLKSEEVKALARVELMEKGVVEVALPEIEEVEKIELPKRTFFAIFSGGEYSQDDLLIVFETSEAAHAFLELRPLRKGRDWAMGQFDYAKPLIDPAVKPVEMPLEHDALNARMILTQNRERTDRNRTNQSEYDTAIREVKKATEGVWSDYYEQKKQAAHYTDIKRTLKEYQEMAGGNQELAISFLLKAYNREDVEATLEWFDLPVSLPSRGEKKEGDE